MSKRDIALGEAPLTIDDYAAVAAAGANVSISQKARSAMRAHRDSLLGQLAAGAVIYGVNTGYGADSTRRLGAEAMRTVQRNTILSHAVGAGEDAPHRIVRGMLLLKASVLAMGFSAVRPELVELICGLLNHDILPVVPQQGSLAASGDLVPSGHLALALLGEGEVDTPAGRMPAAAALRDAALTPIELQEKEGLALVNGTAFTEAYALEVVLVAERLLKSADIAASLTLEAMKGHLTAFSARAVAVRPFAGALAVAENVRALCAGSELLAGPSTRVHDPYCLRCVPQVHGASRDALRYVKDAVDTELNAWTDNPLVFTDGTWASAGNFHAQPIGIPMDLATVLLAEIASISQRRIQHLVSPVYDIGLPQKLSPHPELGSGLFMANTTAAALVSENKTQSFPASVDSMAVDTTEDHVSMGSVAARKALSVAMNVAHVLAIELICAAQALDLHAPAKASKPAGAVHEAVRGIVPFLESDAPLFKQARLLAAAVADGQIVGAAQEALAHPLH